MNVQLFVGHYTSCGVRSGLKMQRVPTAESASELEEDSSLPRIQPEVVWHSGSRQTRQEPLSSG